MKEKNITSEDVLNLIRPSNEELLSTYLQRIPIAKTIYFISHRYNANMEEEISTKDVMDMLRIERNTAYCILEKLCVVGILNKFKTGAGSIYKIKFNNNYPVILKYLNKAKTTLKRAGIKA